MHATGQSASESLYTGLRRGHGILAMLGWGILMIIGTIVARYFKHKDPIWFYLHISLQSVGFILGVIGVICGFILNNHVNANVGTHKSIGIFILLLGCLQVCLFFVILPKFKVLYYTFRALDIPLQSMDISNALHNYHIFFLFFFYFFFRVFLAKREKREERFEPMISFL